MKKYFNFLIIIIAVSFSSCEDQLNPFGDNKELFVLNCVLKNDTPFQSAYLSQSFTTENFDPQSDTEDHSINDAYIRIWFDDSVKIFSDTLLTKVLDNNLERHLTSYYNNDFLTKPDTEYELEAVLHDGRKLSAKTKTPKPIKFGFTSDQIIPPPNKNYVTVKWNSEEPQLYTAARFTFVYFKNENGKNVRYVKEVPRSYVYQDGVYTPYYPEPSYDNGLSVEMNAFDRALQEISEGDPNKENYTILAFILEVLVYDRNLTTYYAAKTELGEGFSITVNENDFSNITGGRGIFGSFIKQRFAIKFSHEYIYSFGYVPGLTE